MTRPFPPSHALTSTPAVARTAARRRVRSAVCRALETLESRAMMSTSKPVEHFDRQPMGPSILDINKDGTPKVDGTSTGTGGTNAGGGSLGVTPRSLDVPSLSSRAGAPKVLYLDFDGQAGFRWGSKDVPDTAAYSRDGDTANFTDAERQDIRDIWGIVAEKYSPFNVNVTTVDPGDLYDGHAAKVVIGGDGSWYKSTAGGVAKREGFYNDKSNVGWVWDGQGATPNLNYIGESVAHEAGHMFGLRHHSTREIVGANSGGGTFAVTPNTEYESGYIMGSGDTGLRPGRWESSLSTDRDSDDNIVEHGTQDDLAVLTDGGGAAFAYRADDHPGIGGADPLAISANGRIGSGVIERTNDLDVFSFTTSGGYITVNLSVPAMGAMLDGTLRVFGNGIDTGTISTGTQGEVWNSGSIRPAGTYYVAVGSRGFYGDIGQYSVGVDLNERFDNTMRDARPLGRFGELATGGFGNAHPFYAGRGVVNDFVGTSDPEDWYQLTLTGTTPVQLSAWLNGLSQDADEQLICDFNGNFQVDPGDVLASSTNSGAASEGLTAPGRPFGSFYLRVYRYSTANTNYSLTTFADQAGTSVNTALNPQTRDVWQNSGQGYQEFYDYVDQYDVYDDYRFTASKFGGDVDVALDTLSADADVYLYRDANHDGVAQDGELVNFSNHSGTTAELILNQALVANDPYVIRVFSYNSNATNYRLWYHTETSTGPDTGNAASYRDLGDLSMNNAQWINEYVGALDAVDTYKFTMRPGRFQLYASYPHAYSLYRDANNNGVFESGEYVGGTGTTLTYDYANVSGDPALMGLKVNRGGGEFPTDANYAVTLVASGTPTIDNFGGAARPIAPAAGPGVVYDYVGRNHAFAAANDPYDNYTFTLDDPQRFLASLTTQLLGTAVDGGPGELNGTPGAPAAGIQLYRDDNGNGVADVGERIGGYGAFDEDGRTLTSLDLNLDAGTYIVRVYAVSGENQRVDTAAGYSLDYSTTDTNVDDPAPTPAGMVFNVDEGPHHLVRAYFSEDVSTTLGDDDFEFVRIEPDGSETALPSPGVTFDPTTFTATLDLAESAIDPNVGTLAAGVYEIRVHEGGGIRDAAGQPLASGDSYQFRFLPGDADGDGTVNFTDLLTLAQNYGQTGLAFSQGNFDYSADGSVDFADLLIVAQRYGQTLLTAANDDAIVATRRHETRVSHDVLA